MRIVVLTGFLICAAIASLGAQQLPTDPSTESLTIYPDFALGDQYFGIHVGAYIPLFLINTMDDQMADTRQTVGGTGSFQWNIYLNQLLSVGIETAYIFSFTPNQRTLSFWPTALKVSFAPLLERLLIPIHLDVGMIFSYLEESTKLDLLLKGGIGFYWFFEREWAIGLLVDYLFVPQIYTGNIAPESDSRILNSLTASIGVIYRI